MFTGATPATERGVDVSPAATENGVSAALASPKKARLNHNVRLTLIYSYALSVVGSLISSTPLAAYILLIRNDSNVAVGVATGIQGLVNLCMAFPIGALSDRFGRQILLRAAAAVNVVAAAYLSLCLLLLPHYFSDDNLYYFLCGSSALWGLFMGLHSAPLDALFADSVPSGSRSRVYVWRSSLRSLGQTSGPLISIIVFLIYGDEWKARAPFYSDRCALMN